MQTPERATQTPASLGYRMPAEWEPHAATWVAWPHNRDTWPGRFEPIPAVFGKLVRTLAQSEPVHVLEAHATVADWALGFRFDIVLRGRDATPFEDDEDHDD